MVPSSDREYRARKPRRCAKPSERKDMNMAPRAVIGCVGTTLPCFFKKMVTLDHQKYMFEIDSPVEAARTRARARARARARGRTTRARARARA